MQSSKHHQYRISEAETEAEFLKKISEAEWDTAHHSTSAASILLVSPHKC
jgi:hypothetical protein